MREFVEMVLFVIFMIVIVVCTGVTLVAMAYYGVTIWFTFRPLFIKILVTLGCMFGEICTAVAYDLIGDRICGG